MHLVSLHTRIPFLIVECILVTVDVPLTDTGISKMEEAEL